jgi:hypothetical protein
MVFGQGEHLPYKKGTAPRLKRSVDRTKSRKCQKKEDDNAEDNAKDGKEDNAEDNEVYDEEDNEEDDKEDDEEADEDYEDHEEDDDKDKDDEEWPLTMEEKQLMGMDYVSQEECRLSVKVAYMREFHSPDECDWQSIVMTLKARLGVSRKLIHQVFQKCGDGVSNPEKQKKGAGRNHQLARDNKGLITRRSCSTQWISISQGGNGNMQHS